MKLYLLCLLLVASVWLSNSPEPDIASLYPVSRYDRCMVAYKGTDMVKECDIYLEK
jgi:hypothetical protein